MPNVEPPLFDRPPSAENVVIVSDDPLARSGLTFLLTSQGLNVMQTTEALVADANAAVAIWDLGADFGSHSNSKSVTDRFETIERSPQYVVALLPNASHASEALNAGARGLLLRNASAESLAAAVKAVAAGLVAVDPSLTSALVPATRAQAPLAEELTARENEVLKHLSVGLANKEIASRMNISDHTVKFHVNAILSKLGAQSRTEAVVQAAKRGLVVL